MDQNHSKPEVPRPSRSKFFHSFRRLWKVVFPCKIKFKTKTKNESEKTNPPNDDAQSPVCPHARDEICTCAKGHRQKRSRHRRVHEAVVHERDYDHRTEKEKQDARARERKRMEDNVISMGCESVITEMTGYAQSSTEMQDRGSDGRGQRKYHADSQRAHETGSRRSTTVTKDTAPRSQRVEMGTGADHTTRPLTPTWPDITEGNVFESYWDRISADIFPSASRYPSSTTLTNNPPQSAISKRPTSPSTALSTYTWETQSTPPILWGPMANPASTYPTQATQCFVSNQDYLDGNVTTGTPAPTLDHSSQASTSSSDSESLPTPDYWSTTAIHPLDTLSTLSRVSSLSTLTPSCSASARRFNTSRNPPVLRYHRYQRH